MIFFAVSCHGSHFTDHVNQNFGAAYLITTRLIPMLQNVDSFIKYFKSIRRRTLTYIQTIPPDQLGWRPKAGEFSVGELIYHMAAAEWMFVGAVVDHTWHYIGHDHAPEADLETTLAHLEATHQAAMTHLATFPDEALLQPCPSLTGPEIIVTSWRFLMAMVEHEVHHRSQLAMYLALLDIEPPHIFGQGVEDVIALATG